MSADEGNGLGAVVRQVIGRHVAFEVSESAGRRRVLCGGCTWSDRPLAELDQPSRESHCDHLTAVLVEAIAPDYDRLTRERDEAREVVGRVRVAMSNHPDPCAKHPEDEDGDTACGWKRAYADVRAALGDDRASGRDQAARPPSTPKRPPEHLTSADEGPHFDDAAWIRDRLEPARSVEWTFDGPAVRPSDDEGELGA